VPISVVASAELQAAFLKVDSAPEYSFADSELLGNSLSLGAHADVFAAAGSAQAWALARQGRIGRPVGFASTPLVVIVPRSNPGHVHTVFDLARLRASLVLGAPGFAFGDQARAVLSRLHLGAASQSANVTAKSPQAIVSRVAGGKADAGIVYAVDVAAAASRVRVISIPAAGAPVVPFEIALVNGSSRRAAAIAFIHAVLSASGQAALRAAGFGKG